METKYRCELCNKEFATAEGLNQHNRDKHSAVTSHDLKEQRRKEREEQQKKEKEKTQRSKMVKRIVMFGGAFLILSAIVYAFLIFGKGTESRLVDENYLLRTNLRTHSGIGMHIHPHLTITINGERMEIPANIGISGGVMSVIHTHDATGTIHLESPTPKDFTVKDFFFVWSQSGGEQKVFNSTCVLGYCNDDNRTVKMFVNDLENNEYENHTMRDLERIQITYE